MYVTHSYYTVISSHSTGTETGMERLSIRDSGTTFICLKWGEPKYSPISYSLRYQCSLMCEKEPYTAFSPVYTPPFIGVNLTNIKPGSTCKLNFVAMYNPAEHDPGVDYVFETKHSSKAYTYCI